MIVQVRNVWPGDLLYVEGRTEYVECAKLGAGRMLLRTVEAVKGLDPVVRTYRLRDDEPVTVRRDDS